MRKFIGKLVFGVVFLAAFCNASAATDNISAACSLSAKKDVKDSLAAFKDSKQWPTVLSCIETGDPDWVRFANAFARSVDHGYKRDQVVFALGVALGNNAHDVLQITQYDFSLGLTLNDICIAPDGGDSRFGSYDQSMSEVGKRKRALVGIQDNELKQDVKTCNEKLERAKQQIALVFKSPDKCILSSASIANQIQHAGAHQTYDDLARGDSTWNALITCIGTGDPAWLRIDVALSGVGDGHGAEELDTAWNTAFGNKPYTVLKLRNQEFLNEVGLDIICSGPDVDDMRFGTYNLAMNEVVRRELLLDSIHDKDLDNDVSECRSDFEQSKKWLSKAFEVSIDQNSQ